MESNLSRRGESYIWSSLSIPRVLLITTSASTLHPVANHPGAPIVAHFRYSHPYKKKKALSQGRPSVASPTGGTNTSVDHISSHYCHSVRRSLFYWSASKSAYRSILARIYGGMPSPCISLYAGSIRSPIFAPISLEVQKGGSHDCFLHLCPPILSNTRLSFLFLTMGFRHPIIAIITLAISSTLAAPSLEINVGGLHRRSDFPQEYHLHRRHEYIESTGQNPSVQLTVPLNNIACSQQRTDSPRGGWERKPLFRMPFTSSFANRCSNGGGTPVSLSPDSASSALSGKTIGGGTRNEIYGSAQYGSGFGTYTQTGDSTTYEPDLTLNVSGHTSNLAFGFLPIPWGDYRGADILSKAWQGYLPGEGYTYRMSPNPYPALYAGWIARKNGDDRSRFDIIGDASTINVIADVLTLPTDKGGCGADALFVQDISYVSNVTEPAVAWTMQAILAFNIHLHPWNIIQYWRGSSVAIGNSTYNNAFAHPNATSQNYWAASPLDLTGVDADWFNCLNRTIAAVIPIVDPTLVVRNRKTPGQIAGIVVGVVIPVLLIAAAVVFWLLRRRKATSTIPAADGKTVSLPSKKAHSSPRSGSVTGAEEMSGETDGLMGSNWDARAGRGGAQSE
ncbi:hypothetical protein FRC19_003892 [Serendipita sp. 401]|nr:hypothetical protein FRC15_009663 [Serendipita sp. 397]KAG8791278.1 hypothetical protein FRC16_000476 [Serendipita sp. 398]KAG8828553.1 hypothetical protein FRC19_003892 [Serendipita sp. 401]KAG9058577.1 hypothetical protein FS842_007999 [Serendipita sp. 407]